MTLIRSTVWFSLSFSLPPFSSRPSLSSVPALSLYASFLSSATLTGLTTPLKALIQLCYDNRIPDLETIKDFFLMFEREYAPINLTFKLKVRVPRNSKKGVCRELVEGAEKRVCAALSNLLCVFSTKLFLEKICALWEMCLN